MIKSKVIQRVKAPGFMDGIPDFVTPEQAARLVVPMFMYQGFDYYVRKLAFRTWMVVKCVTDGRALSEYNIYQDNKHLTCDCFSGRRHLKCRHKEMVTMVKERRQDGIPGEARRDVAARKTKAGQVDGPGNSRPVRVHLNLPRKEGLGAGKSNVRGGADHVVPNRAAVIASAAETLRLAHEALDRSRSMI